MTLLVITIAAVSSAVVVALQTVARRLDSLRAQMQMLVAAEYPLFTHEAIEATRKQVDDAADEVERRSSFYRENRTPQPADVWAECQRWHELQRSDVQLLHAKEALDAMIAGNAAIRAGRKTLKQVREELDELHRHQSSRWSDHHLEMNVYDLLAIDGVVSLSKLKNGHKLLARCERCEAETPVTAQQIQLSPILHCSGCQSPLDDARLFVHPDQATRLGRVQINRQEAN